jgi:hypothetical protein
MPGVPLEGGTLADGTRIRHYHTKNNRCRCCQGAIEHTDLVKVFVHFGTIFVDQIRDFVGETKSRGLELIQQPLLSGNERNDEGPQRPVIRTHSVKEKQEYLRQPTSGRPYQLRQI